MSAEFNVDSFETHYTVAKEEYENGDMTIEDYIDHLQNLIKDGVICCHCRDQRQPARLIEYFLSKRKKWDGARGDGELFFLIIRDKAKSLKRSIAANWSINSLSSVRRGPFHKLCQK
jgi:hypothetical protein